MEYKDVIIATTNAMTSGTSDKGSGGPEELDIFCDGSVDPCYDGIEGTVDQIKDYTVLGIENESNERASKYKVLKRRIRYDGRVDWRIQESVLVARR